MNTFPFNYVIDPAVFRIILIAAIPLAILQVTLMIIAVINLVKKQVPSGDKILWLLLILLVNTIGPIIYLVVGSHALDEKAAQYAEQRENERSQG